MDLRQAVQHYGNPLHVECRLVAAARWMARKYENLVWRPAKGNEATMGWISFFVGLVVGIVLALVGFWLFLKCMVHVQ